MQRTKKNNSRTFSYYLLLLLVFSDLVLFSNIPGNLTYRWNFFLNYRETWRHLNDTIFNQRGFVFFFKPAFKARKDLFNLICT